jgi:hypothetical protein
VQVPWFVDLAVDGCQLASITAEGHVALTSNTATTTNSSSSTAAADASQQHQQTPEVPSGAQFSILAATTLAKLALQHSKLITTPPTSSTDAPPAAAAASGPDQVLLQQLMPHLLSCAAACEQGCFSSHWTSALVAAASALHQTGCKNADTLPALCLQHLQKRFGFNDRSSSSSSVGSSSVAIGVGARGSLQLGDAACLALLAALLGGQQQQQQQQQAALDTGVLHELVSCALTGLCSAGEAHNTAALIMVQDASCCVRYLLCHRDGCSHAGYTTSSAWFKARC